MDCTEPSSGGAQCKPPASPQVGAGTAKGPAGKLDIAASSAATCELLFSCVVSCVLPDGGQYRNHGCTSALPAVTRPSTGGGTDQSVPDPSVGTTA